MQKAELRAMIERQTERFQNIYGGEIVRYAEKDPKPKRLLDKRAGKKPVNLKQQAWEEYIEELKNGPALQKKESTISIRYVANRVRF